MMEVVIVDDGNRLTVYELVERVIPSTQKYIGVNVRQLRSCALEVTD